MTTQKKKKPQPPKLPAKRPQPKVAIAFIDSACVFSRAIRATIPPSSTDALAYLQQLEKALRQATEALAYVPKPQPDHPGQARLDR